MKIHVTAEDNNIRLSIPNWLLFSRGSAFLVGHIMEHMGRKYMPEGMEGWSARFISRACGELRRVKKERGQWLLVEVQSSSGEHVTIYL